MMSRPLRSFVMAIVGMSQALRPAGAQDSPSCEKPPSDVYTTELEGRIKAQIPALRQFAGEVQATATRKAEKIRELLPGVYNFQVLEYTFCSMHRRGLISRTEYLDFVRQVLPIVSDRLPPKGSGPLKNDTGGRRPRDRASIGSAVRRVPEWFSDSLRFVNERLALMEVHLKRGDCRSARVHGARADSLLRRLESLGANSDDARRMRATHSGDTLQYARQCADRTHG